MSQMKVLFRQYVNLINQGDINVASVFDYMVKTVNDSAVSEAVSIFESHFQTLRQSFPVDNTQLNATHITARDAALSAFMNKVMDLERNTECADDLQVKLETLFDKYVGENERTSYDKTTAMLIEIFTGMKN